MDKEIPMSNNKKTAKWILAFLFVCIIVVSIINFMPPWPTKARLCRDVDGYISLEKCLKLKDKFEILDQAFPRGSKSEDIKSALGQYLHDEYQTENGHIEIYYLNVSLMDYIISFPDEYIFVYDKEGKLRGYTYEN